MIQLRPASASARRTRRTAFSLAELVIVVVIIGIVASIAVPRVSSARVGAAESLAATIDNVRQAIDLYYAEHGRYPGYDPTTGLPNGDRFKDQLLKFSDAQGRTSDTYGAPYVHGPYLRPPFPKNPTNNLDTVHVKAKPGDPTPADGSVGWLAVLSHGYFAISATDAEMTKMGVDDDTKTALRGGGAMALGGG